MKIVLYQNLFDCNDYDSKTADDAITHELPIVLVGLILFRRVPVKAN